MKKAKLFLLVILLSLFSVIILADGNLRFAIETEPVGLDPNQVTAFASHRILENVYDGLLRYDETMQLVPNLAKTFKVEDAYTVVFKLRDTVYFHDGTQMTAEDVLYTFDRIRDPDYGSPAASYYADVESIKALDDKT